MIGVGVALIVVVLRIGIRETARDYRESPWAPITKRVDLPRCQVRTAA